MSDWSFAQLSHWAAQHGGPNSALKLVYHNGQKSQQPKINVLTVIIPFAYAAGVGSSILYQKIKQHFQNKRQLLETENEAENAQEDIEI